jgi:hypothetical protein
VRQNYINLRDGAGEVNTIDQSQVLIMQQEELMNQSIRFCKEQERKGSIPSMQIFTAQNL